MKLNKKIGISAVLLCKLFYNNAVSSSGLNNGVLLVNGTFNIGSGSNSSISASSVIVTTDCILNNGNNNYTGTLYIDNTGDRSEINGTLNNMTLNNSNFLNDGFLYITRQHVYTNNVFSGYSANKYAYLKTIGLFINQGTIVVGANGAHLNTDSSFTNSIRGGILNGFSHNKNITGATKYYRYNNNAIEPVTDNNAEPRDGKIIFIPGAALVDVSGEGYRAQINGGIIDLTKYLEIKLDTNVNKYYIDFEYLLKSDAKNDNGQYEEPYNVNAAGTVADTYLNVYSSGCRLYANIQNATIQLFNETELANAVKLYNKFTEESATYILFRALTFANCVADIPNDICGYTAKNIEIPYADETNIINDTKNLYKYKRTINDNFYPLTANTSDNYGQVKQLFSYSQIYHGIYKSDGRTIDKVYNPNGSTAYNSGDANPSMPTDGLILLNNSVVNDSSFSDLFNKYINYNCYIDLSNNTLYNETSAENTGGYLNLQFDYFGTHTLNTPYTKNIYIQLIGNKDICISNSHIEIENEEEVSKQYDDNLKLVLNNSWQYRSQDSSDEYSGKIYRMLPTTAINYNNRTTQIYQNYEGAAFNNYKITISAIDNTKTNKNDCTTSEILYYTLSCDNNTFSAGASNNPFVVDKFTVGEENQNINVTCNSPTHILTQNFVVNQGSVFNFCGNMTVRKLTTSDFA